LPVAFDPRLFFIVNPRAGLGMRRFASIRTRLQRLDVPFAGAATTGPGDASTLARMACEHHFRAIVAVGGDGTVNEVLNGMASTEGEIHPHAALGVIPTGTAQDFARSMGIPLAPDAALDALLGGRITRVDVGRIRFGDGRLHLFANMLGAGFDAEVAGRAQDVRGAMSSIPAHVVGFASARAAYRTKEITITLEGTQGEPKRVHSNLVVVANGPSYAGVMRLAPDAVVDDGLLDVTVIGDVDALEFLINLPRAFTGTHLAHHKVDAYRVRSLSLESQDDALVQADGELLGRLPATVDVLPGALKLIR
jgi:diacylglycerol kinase (ATP)